MSNFSAYVEQSIYDWMVLNTAMPATTANIYLGLSTADPVDDASGLAEPVGGGYAREIAAFGARGSVNGTGTSGSNSGIITFTTATGSWGAITHGALFDAISGGNMLAFWQWTVPKTIGVGDTFIVAIGDLELLIR